MMVPGSNLLKIAQKLIRFQSVDYYKATGRTMNAARQWVPTYGAATQLQASVQAVSRKTYAQLGLNLNAYYVNIFASLDLIDLARDSSGDKFIYNGDEYKMAQGENWHAQDGWATCLATKVNVP